MMLVEQTTVPAQALPVAEFKDHLRLGLDHGVGRIGPAAVQHVLAHAEQAFDLAAHGLHHLVEIQGVVYVDLRVVYFYSFFL